MKKIYLTLIIFCAIAAGSIAQVPSEQIVVGEPHIVNFQQLADYEAAHPKAESKRFIEQGEDKDADFKFTPRPITGEVTKFDVTLPEEDTRTASPSPNIVFNGWCPTTINLIPPDVSGACGDSLILETNNQRFDIYQRNGTHVTQLSINTLFSPSGGSGYFDPHIYFDKNYHRYVIVIDGTYSNGNSGLFLAISQTNMPNGNWYIYGFDAIGNANDFLDFPLLGMNNKWIVVTGNDFINGNNPVYSKIYVMNRATLYSGGSLTVTTFTDQQAFTLAPAVTYDTTLANEYLVCDWNGDSANYGYVRLYQISGAVGSPAYSAVGFIAVNQPWDENSVGAPQVSDPNTLEDGDTRISSAQYINGSLWFTHTVFLPAGSPTHDAVDWYQVNPATNSIQQYGRINDPSGVQFYFYPSIAVNYNNDALIGYAVSSANIHPSAQYSFRQSTDPLNTFESGYLFKAGLNTYFQDFGSGRNRWGDYSYTCIDPMNGSFWTFQEWANATADTWGTVIANVAGIACSGTPIAGTISAANDTLSCSGQSTVLTLTGYSTGFTGINLNWEQSPDGTNWSTVSGGSGNGTDTYTTPALSATTYYRCVVSCVNSGGWSATNVVIIVIPGVTSVTGDTSCVAQSFTLSATGVGTLYWYDAPTFGNLVNTGNAFFTPVLSVTTTYYVESHTVNPVQTVGPVDNTIGGGGNYNNATNDRFEIFDAYVPFTLVSVKVYASGTANRTFRLRDAAGNTLHDTIINIPNGTQVVTLNMSIPAGTGLQFGVLATANLYRNNAGAVYPYTLAGVCSITGNSAGATATAYYYFCYDWHVHVADCISARTAVTAVIGSANIPTVTPSGPLTICSGANVVLTASGSGPWQWSTGATTQSITVTTAGTYYVSVYDAVCAMNLQSANITVNVIPTPVASFTSTPGGLTFNFNNTSTGATSWQWMFGDSGGSNLQNPVHTYSAAGNYTVTLIACNGNCCDTTTSIVNAIDVSVPELIPGGVLILQPNPTSGKLSFKNYLPAEGDEIKFSDVLGQIIFDATLTGKKEIDISALPNGIYFVQLSTSRGKMIGKVMKD